MSKTAKGHVTMADGILTATFGDVEGYKYTYSMSFSSAPPSFQANVVTVHYNNRNDDLIGNPPFTAKIGVSDITINISGGTKIDGPLANSLSAAHDVTGAGSWTKL
jgi:hypothetical protein